MKERNVNWVSLAQREHRPRDKNIKQLTGDTDVKDFRDSLLL